MFTGMLLLAIALALTLSLVDAWGFTGHRLVAAIAETRLRQPARTAIDRLLKYDGRQKSFVDIATWADEIKRMPQYRFASSLHYVNPKDDEPQKCSFKLDLDCPVKRSSRYGPDFGHCIVGAISNYTYRLTHSRSLAVKSEALKFLVHFIGDIHQPLHVSGRARGGNDFKVRFFGAKSNLHSVWDGGLLNRMIKQVSLNVSDVDFDISRQDDRKNFDAFLQQTVDKIEDGWDGQVGRWTTCKRPSFWQSLFSVQLFNFRSAVPQTAACPVDWATATNRVNCNSVWPNTTFSQSEVELGQEYQDANAPLVELAIAQGGVRLANTLNLIFEGQI